MDSNNKNISPVNPLPPSNLSEMVMYYPGVQMNSVRVSSAQSCNVWMSGVHVCNAGNVNARLNRGLESCAWLVVCHSLPRGAFRGTFTAVPMAVDLCSTLTLWNIALMYAIG
jgi:hypothetical protein